jgi:hypothetical protein
MSELTDAELHEVVEFEFMLLVDRRTGYRRTISKTIDERIAAMKQVLSRLESLSAGTAPRELGVRPLTEGPMSKGGQNIPEVDADGFLVLGPRPPTPQGSGGAAYRQSKECGE